MKYDWLMTQHESRCPYCEHHGVISVTKAVEGGAPLPGEWSVCIQCGMLMVFGKDLHPRLPDPDELADLEADCIIRDLVTLALEIHRYRKLRVN